MGITKDLHTHVDMLFSVMHNIYDQNPSTGIVKSKYYHTHTFTLHGCRSVKLCVFFLLKMLLTAHTGTSVFHHGGEEKEIEKEKERDKKEEWMRKESKNERKQDIRMGRE